MLKIFSRMALILMSVILIAITILGVYCELKTRQASKIAFDKCMIICIEDQGGCDKNICRVPSQEIIDDCTNMCNIKLY